MSDGPSDAAAEGRIYRSVWNAFYELRVLLLGDERQIGRFDHATVGRVNTLIEDLGWRLQLAQYAEPHQTKLDLDYEALWKTVVVDLRTALDRLNIGHRGWAPGIDPTVNGLLNGTGYELRRKRHE